jgi:hypothetical protein
MKTAALLATMLLIAACGSGPHPTTARATPGATALPTAVPSSSPSPSRVVACSESNRCYALVTLRGGSDVVVRDITDLLHPKTIGNFGPSAGEPQFVSATDVSYFDGSGVVRAPLSGTPKSTTPLGSVTFRWSPDGQTIAYLDRTTLHLVSGGTDHVAAGSFAALPEGFGCESQVCGDTWDFVFEYSPDGHFISWAQNVTNVFRV